MYSYFLYTDNIAWVFSEFRVGRRRGGCDETVSGRCDLHCVLLLHMQEGVQMLILWRAFCLSRGTLRRTGTRHNTFL